MRDAFGRTIDYMRVSIIDRCNLRCRYCMPKELPFISHDQILRFEEILRLCSVAARIGIRNVKVTGGEPLVRRDCIDFIRKLKSLPEFDHVTLTTNAVRLGPYVEALAQCSLDGVNISLDSLDPATYLWLTGQDVLDRVLSSLHRAVQAGLHVKINCVPLKGVNDSEIQCIAALAEQYPVDVRFIEFMPTSSAEPFEHVTGAQVLALLQDVYPDLASDGAQRGFGPARYFSSARLKGCIGIIDAVSNHFCGSCNRVRLTSEGYLKLCLYHDDGLDLRVMLRGGATDFEMETAIANAIRSKPERHFFQETASDSAGVDRMSRIGG